MNPGTLDRKIQLHRATGTADRFGQEIATWTLWQTRMAARLKTKGKEGEGNARERAEASVAFRLRHTPGLRITDRLVDTRDGQAYDIQDWDGDERQGWMEIYCTRHRTPENEGQAIQPDALVVEGAGTAATNGVYLRDGDNGGKPKYVIVGGDPSEPIDTIAWTSGIAFWLIAEELYSSAEDVATPDLVQGWTVESLATAPAPTVRRATWADIDAAGIDRSTVPTL